MTTWSSVFKQTARFGGNLLLSSLMNSNDAKMFGGLKYQPEFFTKSEKDSIKKFFITTINNKIRGKIKLVLKTFEIKEKNFLYCLVELYKDNEFKALLHNNDVQGTLLFLVIQKDFNTNTTFNSKRAPILQFIDNKFKLKLSLRITSGPLIKSETGNQIGNTIIGKSEFYTLHQSVELDRSLGKKFLNAANEIFTDKTITEKDFINDSNIKAELEHFAESIPKLFDVTETGKSELEILLNQAKAGRIESIDVFDKMKTDIIKAVKTKGRLVDTGKKTTLVVSLSQISNVVEFKFSSKESPQYETCIIINFKKLKITGKYIDTRGHTINVSTFSRSDMILKSLSKRIFENKKIKNEYELNDSFLNVLVMSLKSSQVFKDSMQIHF